MAIIAEAGPQIIYGITVSSSGATGEYNEQRAPSLMDLGDGLLDPRSQFNYGYQPGQGVQVGAFGSSGGSSAQGPQTMGFWGQQAVVDYIPGTISSNVIALTQVPVSGTPITLTASGINTTSVSIIAPETNKSTTVICIDAPCGGSTNQGVQFGVGTVQIWNPQSVCGRGINIFTSSNLDTGGWSISGRDVYGFKVTETISTTAAVSTGTNALIFVSKKTYKYINQIVSTGTVASTGVTVGTNDLYGFPMYVNHPGYINLWIGNASTATLITANTGAHTFGSSLATATSTNGDVRGTYLSSLASSTSGGMRVTMFVSPMIAGNVGAATLLPSSMVGLNNVGPTLFSPFFGAAQFSSV